MYLTENSVSIINTNRLIICSEIRAACSENHIEHMNTEWENIGGIYSYRCVLECVCDVEYHTLSFDLFCAMRVGGDPDTWMSAARCQFVPVSHTQPPLLPFLDTEPETSSALSAPGFDPWPPNIVMLCVYLRVSACKQVPARRCTKFQLIRSDLQVILVISS